MIKVDNPVLVKHFSGSEWRRQQSPIIYGWFRGEECLYVGKSTRGLNRVLSAGHHVIGKRDRVLGNDSFRILWLPLETTEHELDVLEVYFIGQHRPKFNDTHLRRRRSVKSGNKKRGRTHIRKLLDIY